MELSVLKSIGLLQKDTLGGAVIAAVFSLNSYSATRLTLLSFLKLAFLPCNRHPN